MATRFDFDVVSLLTLGLGEITDQEVIRLARSMARVIITLDSDFVRPPSKHGKALPGIIYLDLPNNRRYVPEIEQLLGDFFEVHGKHIDLDHAVVTLFEDRFEVHQ